jgi:hypothetical protein
MTRDALRDVCHRDCIALPEISRSKLFLSFEASTKEGFQSTDDRTPFDIIQMPNFKQIN